MTERQAWLTIAEVYATELRNRTPIEFWIAHYGCCGAINEIEVSDKVWKDMNGKIRECLTKSAYFCQYSPQNDLLRADFCYLMYYSCEDEAA